MRAGSSRKVMWTTVLSLVLVLAMMLTACSGGNSGSETQGTETGARTETNTETSGSSGSDEPAGEEAPKFDTFEHITMYVPAGKVPDDLDLINQAISDYIRDKLNADFELHVIEWGSWKDTINLKIASNEEFDIVWTAAWDNFAARVQQGAFSA